MKMKKYEFTGEVKVEFGHTLNRIRLLVDLPSFRKGSIGGWIESEKNLSHEGSCWVSGNGRVFENGQVSGNGKVSGNGLVSGVAVVKHKFSSGVCVNVCTDPYRISYSGFELIEGKKVHFVSVGCQDHSVENWLNETYRNQIISSTKFPEKKVDIFLHTLQTIILNQGLEINTQTVISTKPNRDPKTGRWLKKNP